MRCSAVMMLLPALTISACATVPATSPENADAVYAGLLVEGPPKSIFDYTPDFRDQTAIPLLQKAVGESWRYYDIDLPLIATRPDGAIAIVFSFDFEQGTCPDYANPPYVTILIDPKTGNVVDVIRTIPGD